MTTTHAGTTGEPRDFLGRPIHVGDMLAYARSEGRSSTLNLGMVTSITYSTTTYTPHNARRAGLASPVLRVEIADAQWESGTRRYSAAVSHTSLYYPERTLLVPIEREDMWRLMQAHIDRRYNHT